jgi:hypothetical protein
MMSIVAIWALISGSWTGRIIAAATVLLVSWKVNNVIVGQKAVKRFVEKSVKEGRARNAKAEKVREKSRQPGAADRLLREYCRDC